MSKHKHYHSTRSIHQALAHARREQIGPMRRRPPTKETSYKFVSAAGFDKKTAPSSAKADGGKAEME